MKRKTEQLSPDGIMQLGLAFWGSKTLLTAIGLGLFTEFAKKPFVVLTTQNTSTKHTPKIRGF